MNHTYLGVCGKFCQLLGQSETTRVGIKYVLGSPDTSTHSTSLAIWFDYFEPTKYFFIKTNQRVCIKY